MVAQLLVRQEVSVSGSEPSKQTFRVRRPVIKVIPAIPPGMTPYSEIALGIVGFGNRFFMWDTEGAFAAWNDLTVGFADKFIIWDLPSGTARDIPVSVSGGGIGFDGLGNILVCSISHIYVYNAASGTLLATLARGIVGSSNFGSQMDNVTVSGISYLLMLTNSGFARNFSLLTKTGSGPWGIVWEAPTSNFTSTNSALGTSVGPQYGYFIGESASTIIRVDVDIGGLTEVIITPSGLTAGIAICHYAPEIDGVVIVCQNGDIFVYDPTLGTLLNSKLGNGFVTATLSSGLCKRMSAAPGQIGIVSDANLFYIFQLSDLALLQVIDPTTAGWSLLPLSEPEFYFNPEEGMIFAPLHANDSFFLFMPQPIPGVPEQIISESQFSSLQGNFLQVIDLIGPAPLPDTGDLRAGPDDRHERAIGKLAEWD